MRDAVLWIVIVGLGWVVVFHLYWAAGGRVGADAVIPRRPAAKGGEALFHPSPLGTLIVALFLLGVIAFGGGGSARCRHHPALVLDSHAAGGVRGDFRVARHR